MPGREASPDRAIAEERAVRDAQAEVYDEYSALTAWDGAAINASLRLLLELEGARRVIDAGCGTGLDLPWLLESPASVIGVDHSQRSLELARRRLGPEHEPRAELIEADIRELPIADRSADRVLCSEVLQHLPTADSRLQCVREWIRVLVPGGIAALAVYRWLGHSGWRRDGFFESEHGRIPFHAFTAHELRRLLTSAGFTDVLVGATPMMPRLSRRLGIGAEAQARLAFAPLARHVGGYLVARGVRPRA